MGHLSTHVLDTSRGLPAAGVLIEVRIIRGSESQRVAAAFTNAQGRTDAPLLISPYGYTTYRGT